MSSTPHLTMQFTEKKLSKRPYGSSYPGVKSALTGKRVLRDDDD